MKFKRFLLIKREGKEDGEYYRIPAAPLAALFLFSLTAGIGGIVWFSSERSPQMIRRERLEELKQQNRQLDTILTALRKKMDTTSLRSENIELLAESLRSKAALPKVPDTAALKKHTPLSIPFLQTYTDSISRFLFALAEDSNRERWHSLPTISPVPMVHAAVIASFGQEFEAFSGVRQKNKGILFAAPKGTPVRAAAEGTVLSVRKDPQKGTILELQHEFSVKTYYGHLESVSVSRGKKVKKGDQIGTVGESGWSVGPRLYYEITKNGRPVDPSLLTAEAL